MTKYVIYIYNMFNVYCDILNCTVLIYLLAAKKFQEI